MTLGGGGRGRIGAGALLLLAALLTACGLWGDTDEQASEPTPLEQTGPLRVTFGDRWFEISIDELELRPDGTAPPSVIESLLTRVADLGVEPTEARNATMGFDGERFVAVPGRPGETADAEALVSDLVDAERNGIAQVPVPFRPVPPAVDETRVGSVADELNGRTESGITVSVETESRVLPRSLIGPATTVTVTDSGWDTEVRWEELADPIAAFFPDVGEPGGDASFTVEPAEEDGEPGTVVIVPGPPATVCCDSSSARRIEQALENDVEVARLFLARVDPERGVDWAEDLQIVELVGSFTTRYTPGQSRVINIRRIAELTQGAVIVPGESFSLNDFVGRRTVEKGFVPAGTIVNGHLVDSVGGGISQFATTIFNAAFFAGLEFDTYQSHSIYFSRYPYGREATISWPAPNLVIRNPSPYGVLIWPTSTASSVTVDIYSTTWAPGEQTGQWSVPIQVACTRVTTERTRTFVEDGRTETDTVIATYRPEGIACDGTETEDPDAEQVERLENGQDPNFANGGNPTGEDADAPAGDGVPPEDQPPPEPEPAPEPEPPAPDPEPPTDPDAETDPPTAEDPPADETASPPDEPADAPEDQGPEAPTDA